MLEYFMPSFVTLFVIADPVGTAAIFLALAHGYSDEQTRKTAMKASIIAAGLMLLFGVAGAQLIPLLGITLPAFRIAGGLLLFVTAYRMVMGQREKQRNRESGVNNPDNDNEDIAVFPLAIPLLCGPGCMTASILLMDKPNDLSGHMQVGAAMIAVQIVSYFCLRYAPNISRVIGSTGTSIIARVMGVLLAAMAIQFIADGIKTM